jgi:Domain of unknown function (DUF1963)
MFGRKKSQPISNNDFRRELNESLRTGAAAEVMKEFLDYQSATEQMQELARSSNRPAAVLMPQIPIGSGSSAGWFGGNAMLPDGMAWPEQDGQKLLFLGQIDLSVLPQHIWSGVGPRTGWLAFFLPEHGELKPTVLHFTGRLIDAKGPFPNNADWTRLHNFDEPKTFALPKWPLSVETQFTDLLHSADAGKINLNSGTLLDPAFHPYDYPTISLLLETLESAVFRLAKDVVRFPAMKKLRSGDATWFEQHKPIILNTFARYFEIEGRMRAKSKLDPNEVAEFVAELAELEAYDTKYLRDDDEGYCELELREAKLLDEQPEYFEMLHWWDGYRRRLTSFAIKTYTSDPSLLPRALRERLEAEWKIETSAVGLGAMGHAPRGYIYTPHGPDSPNEVLLEVHTSQLAGWIWGDCYSLVLLIDRAALRRGDFSNVMWDITN